MSSRRSFIRQGLMAAGGLVLSSSAMGRVIMPRKPRVIIIGAGLAGLSAALELRKQKVDVTILESRNRIGGRVFSHAMDKDLVVELGGEWIGNSHERIQNHCNAFGLDLFNNQMDTHLIYKGEYAPAGKWDYSDRWKASFQKIINDYPHLSDDDKRILDNMDWWRYLVNNGCEGRDLDIRELLDSTDFGESIRHVSAFAALAEYAESSPHNEMDLKIRGGNSMLPKRMAERIGRDRIHMGHKVTRIVQDRKVTVYCDNGKVFTADNLICAIPTFALNRIDWQPGFPADRQAAINELQYARINKHALLFEDRFWKDEAFDLVSDQLPHYFYHATKNQDSKRGVLIAYATGDKAAVLANQSDQWIAGQVADTLSAGWDRKSIAGNIIKQERYYWGNDAYSHGAYALYGKGQWFRVRDMLSRPFVHTIFAGEHLADWQGFMEGAIQSGEEAAGRIIR